MVCHRDLQAALIANRAEEFDLDVSSDFVVPPFFHELSLMESMKPWIIQGGRGSGKTMLLRYLSHYSQLSHGEPSHACGVHNVIGLYWRIDTQFASAMKGQGIPDDKWRQAFDHLVALSIAEEVVRSCVSLSRTCEDGNEALIDLPSYGSDFVGNLETLLRSLDKRVGQFELWLNNIGKVEEPIFLPARRLVLDLIDSAKGSMPALQNTTFKIFIDEYENLEPYQQELINTYLKHSERPFIFNVATKKNGMITRNTTGSETIQDRHDYRTVDLDELLHDHGFSHFAAEVLFLRLDQVDSYAPPIDSDQLRSANRLREREDERYRKDVQNAARNLLPGWTQKAVAEEIFENSALKKRLRHEIEHALKRTQSNLDPGVFLNEHAKDAAVVSSCLLWRRRLRPEEIKEEIEKFTSGEPNKFSGKTNWIHNNFVGQALRLYESARQPCPIYAGFDAYTEMARGNIRHFLELCYKALRYSHGDDGGSDLTIPMQSQAIAARDASIGFLKETRALGRRGNQLYTLVMALGSLFRIAQRRPTQSEPEINHFAVRGEGLSAHQEALLLEAEKWSVLFEEKETKSKDPINYERTEWVINPVYAPYFNISYRKRRKLELESSELDVLMSGNFDATKALLSKYKAKWEVESDVESPDLFEGLV